MPSFSGKIVHKFSDKDGIIKFFDKEKPGIAYVYFLTSNVYITESSKANSWVDIEKRKSRVHFEMVKKINITAGTDGYLAGAVWYKENKPKNPVVEECNEKRAISAISSYYRLKKTGKKGKNLSFGSQSSSANSSVLDLSSRTASAVPANPTKPKDRKRTTRKKILDLGAIKEPLTGISGYIWKVINDHEGLFNLTYRGLKVIVWFNSSNIHVTRRRFKSLYELLDVPFHIDAELIFAPMNSCDFFWFYACVIWEEKTKRPVKSGHSLGLNLYNYNPTSKFSKQLKESWNLVLNSRFASKLLDNLFNELSKLANDLPKPRVQKPVLKNEQPEDVNNVVAHLASLLNETLQVRIATKEKESSSANVSTVSDVKIASSSNSQPSKIDLISNLSSHADAVNSDLDSTDSSVISMDLDDESHDSFEIIGESSLDVEKEDTSNKHNQSGKSDFEKYFNQILNADKESMQAKSKELHLNNSNNQNQSRNSDFEKHLAQNFNAGTEDIQTKSKELHFDDSKKHNQSPENDFETFLNQNSDADKEGTKSKRKRIRKSKSKQSQNITPKIKEYDHDCFKTPQGHLLNIEKTITVKDTFFHDLQHKINNSKENQTSTTDLLNYFNDLKSIDEGYDEKIKRTEYLQSLPLETLYSWCLKIQPDKVKYILKEKGILIHTSEKLRYGCILSKYGLVVFNYDNFFDFKDNHAINPGMKVIFDAIKDEVENCKYSATCIWTSKRPDVLTLVNATDMNAKTELYHSKYYRGIVVRLDLPSNAIILTTGTCKAVVASRKIFDSSNNINIADYLSLGQYVNVLMEKNGPNNFYVKDLIRIYEVPDDLTKMEGYGEIIGYSTTTGVFEVKSHGKLLKGVFNKDLARIFGDNGHSQYLGIGSFIKFCGFVGSSCLYATEIEATVHNFHTETSVESLIPGKVYVGTVHVIKPPYAFVIKVKSEIKTEEFVFVSSRTFEPVRGRGRLSYYHQVQFFIRVGDKVEFMPEKCGDFGGLHSYLWTVAKAWKENGDIAERDAAVKLADHSVHCTESEESFLTSKDYYSDCEDWLPITNDSDSDESFSTTVSSEPPSTLQSNNVSQEVPEKPENKFDLKQCLKDCIKNEIIEADSDAIIQSFCNRILTYSPNDVLQYIENIYVQKKVTITSHNEPKSSVQTEDKGVQSTSTGNVIYWKIFSD